MNRLRRKGRVKEMEKKSERNAKLQHGTV